MKLTEEDRAYLRDTLKEDTESIRQIEQVLAKTTFKIDKKRLTAEEVIEQIGREDFLSGMDRCAFHVDAVRITPEGEEIYFDSRRYFKEPPRRDTK